MATKQEDHWSSEAYQTSASFVPRLAGKVLGWLDVQPDDRILDVGCGDGVLDVQIGEVLKKGKGNIHGIDSSEDMIENARQTLVIDDDGHEITTFEVLDATKLIEREELQKGEFDKVFSNAAMHWILRPEERREILFQGVKGALKSGGAFCFEMGGMGNVAEMRTALLSVIGRKVGLPKAREVDPWFFPDELWMTKMLEETVGGWKVEKIEREYRPTKADEGGVEGWVRLMGKQFFDAVAYGNEREECIKEVVDILKTVTGSPGGGDWFGYVRLRVLARKI